MGVCGHIKDTLSQAKFTPSTLMSSQGALHLLEILLCAVTFVLACFKGSPHHTYWCYAMFTWAFCGAATLAITVVEMFKLDVVLNMFCLDWADFSTGMAMSSALMTVSVAIMYANFYACWTCWYAWIVIGFAAACGLAYALEVVKDKILDKKKGVYLAALPGFWKVLEAFVSCVIFISLTGYRGRLVLTLCVVAYALPFPPLPVIIALNVLKKLRKCLPFNLDRAVFVYLLVSVLLYLFAAVMWPLFMFRNHPRPHHCPPGYCIWAIEFMVAFMTYVNLILYTLDLVFTLFGICGFKRS